MKINSHTLNKASVISNINCIASIGVNGNFIIPNWKKNRTDDVYEGDGGYSSTYPQSRKDAGDTTDSGDRPITPECLFIDTDCTGGDLIIASGWGTGFTIRRLDSDGKPYLLYSDKQFNETPYRSEYNHISSMAVDTVNKKVYMGTAWTSNCGLIIVDYSDYEDSDTWVDLQANDKTMFHCNGTINNDSNETSGWQADTVGSHYFNGLALAGNWLYFTQTSTYHGEAHGAQRFNVNTFEYEVLPELNQTSGYMRRGHVWYDAPRDRIFVNSYYGNAFHVVTDASSDTAAESINIGQFGENRDSGFILDDDDSDIVYLFTNDRIRKIDIGPALAKTGADGTVLTEYYDLQFSVGYMKLAAPTGTSDFMQIIADRGWHRNNSYLDWDNKRVVGVLKDTTDVSIPDHLFHDYGNWVRRVKSNDGTYFDLITGYGWHGSKYFVWADGEGTGFEESASVEFGTYALDGNKNITDVYFPGMEVVNKTGTSVSIQVSNNTGSSWEAYTVGDLHRFSTTGNGLRAKFTFSNPADKASYIWDSSKVVIMKMGKIKRGIYKFRRAFKSRRNWIRRK